MIISFENFDFLNLELDWVILVYNQYIKNKKDILYLMKFQYTLI